MASRREASDRELVAFSKNACEYMATARLLNKGRSPVMLEMDLEMLEAIVKAEAAPGRVALIRLLWREVADGGGCACDDGDPRPTDTCVAMRALGWGQHWDAKVFQRKAMQEDASG